jgi:hypothetical protein
VKTHNFLKSQPCAQFDTNGDDEKSLISRIYQDYQKRLLRQITGVLIWLLGADIRLLKDGWELLPSNVSQPLGGDNPTSDISSFVHLGLIRNFLELDDFNRRY